DRTTALAQLTLEANARFADLPLEAVAGRRAAALEAAQLLLGLGRGRVRGERVADRRDDPVTRDQGGADGNQHGPLGVVAHQRGGVARGRLGLLDGGLALVHGAGAGTLGAG